MSFLSSLWLVLNVCLIVLILIRSPNEQSLQEKLEPLNLFDSSKNAEKKIDQLISFLVAAYFLIGFLLSSKAP